MLLHKANGEIWNPYYEETRVLDHLLRQIVDAIRYRRTSLDSTDPYGHALARLSEAATKYTATLRSNPAAAGPVPAPHWVSQIGPADPGVAPRIQHRT